MSFEVEGERAFLGLGSNLGDRWKYLREAVDQLPDKFALSQVYETAPVGGPMDQGPYLNMVVELRTHLEPLGLLSLCQQLESDAQRVRVEVNGPRTLDVDILLVGNKAIDLPGLKVPHPRMWERRFVLVPLAELAPELLPEDWDSSAIGDVAPVGSL